MGTTSRTCRWVCRRLPLLAGGDLVGTDRRRVERHLIGCPGCQARRDAARSSLAVLRRVAPLHPGPEPAGGETLWPALSRQIRESRHRAPRRVASVPEWIWAWRESSLPFAALASLAASALVGVGWFWTAGHAAPADRGHLVLAGPVAPTPVAPALPSPPSPEPRVIDDAWAWRLLDEYDALAQQAPRPRASALPDEDGLPGATASAKPGSDPFAPPLSLGLSYDLDWGRLAGPAANPQRAY